MRVEGRVRVRVAGRARARGGGRQRGQLEATVEVGVERVVLHVLAVVEDVLLLGAVAHLGKG